MSRMPLLGRGFRMVSGVILLMRAEIAGTTLGVQWATMGSAPSAIGGDFPLLHEVGKVARRAGWGMESSHGSSKVCGDGRAMRPASMQRAIPLRRFAPPSPAT